MTEKDFQDTIDAIANVMTAYHNRLLRVEEWMLKQEGITENEERETAS